MQKNISLTQLVGPGPVNPVYRLLLWVADWVLGIRSMNRLYHRHQMQGLSKEAFVDKMLEVLNVSVEGADQLKQRIPKSGPLVIASNHPFGGIEGVILARTISAVRPDLKVLANQGLKLFSELEDYFIFTNPLSSNDPTNGPSLRRCIKHVKGGNALLIFPAGRVSYYQAHKQRISEHAWNRIVARLCEIKQCHYLPVFIAGQNSALFYQLGRIYFRFRLLMLSRQLLNKRNARIRIDSGFAIKGSLINSPELCRALSYAQSVDWQKNWPPNTQNQMHPVATPIATHTIEAELAELPQHQHLVTHKHYQVYFAKQQQIPNTVNEIARLREMIFRQYDEGSGQPIDTDKFDATYTHLFVYDEQARELVGAYRMGQTDQLVQQYGFEGLYLSKMFCFSSAFINHRQPCLEMGRSFLIPRMQKTLDGLYLLWRGIGAFVCLYPQYRTLYGTVSISKLYDVRSVALMERAFVSHSPEVKPKTPFIQSLHPELADYAQTHPLHRNIGALLKSLEADGKSIPVLMRQYLKMGATMHCLGIDSHFNHTPGMLLSVDLDKAPERLMKLYLGADYVRFKQVRG